MFLIALPLVLLPLSGQELRAQYRLSFTPDEEASAAGYHEIVLTLGTQEEKKLTIQTRDGYYTRD